MEHCVRLVWQYLVAYAIAQMNIDDSDIRRVGFQPSRGGPRTRAGRPRGVETRVIRLPVPVADLARRLGIPPERAAFVTAVTARLLDHLAANRQEKLVMAGAANLVRTEDDFSGSIYPVLEAIEEQVTLLKLFSEVEVDRNGVAVSIGRENAEFGLGETSVLSSGYTSSGGTVARLGVLGPTRMDYSNNMAAVRAVARYLTRLLGED